MPVKNAPVRVAPRARVLAPSWELGVRYAAAYICTLLAIVAAQPKIDFAFAACLYGVTALGLPISLALRRRGLRWRGYSISRRFVNGLIFFSAVLTSAVYLQTNLPAFVPGEDFNNYLLRLDARAIELLMGIFLIIAVCRCMFILNDKDALLCTVPSFLRAALTDCGAPRSVSPGVLCVVVSRHGGVAGFRPSFGITPLPERHCALGCARARYRSFHTLAVHDYWSITRLFADAFLSNRQSR
jgi:hypothetical protein